MKHEINTWLEDINIAIKQIYDFLPEDIKYSDFEDDIKTQKAIERNIEIIGEALNRILKLSPDIAISDSRKIVDTRNRIIHGYDSITPDILWLIIKRSLPILQKEISELLK
jgi:uncharacterized protein with HEPN domain